MSEENGTTRPSFSSPLYAALRQGSKEMAQALKAFPDSVQPVEEPGTLGNPTPQMVTDAMHAGKSFEERVDEYASRSSEADAPDAGMER